MRLFFIFSLSFLLSYPALDQNRIQTLLFSSSSLSFIYSSLSSPTFKFYIFFLLNLSSTWCSSIRKGKKSQDNTTRKENCRKKKKRKSLSKLIKNRWKQINFYEKKMRDYLLRVFEYFHLLQNMLFPRRSSSSSSQRK